ncbi:MAG: redoxin domain-containing protein [Deltaproteobacteria bacterium]|nr:redoxin domain-containing protein [Deltaproteobacteria bacterium]
MKKRTGPLWLGLVAATLLAVAPAAAAFKYVEEGQKAPDFTVQSLGGEAVRLQNQLGPKALAVVFWATWSPRSRPALDDLEAMLKEKERKDKGLAVLAVNVDHEFLSAEDRRAIAELAAHWSFPVLVDEGLSVFSTYGVVATPSVAVLDPQGIVRYSRAGYSSSAKEDLREAVDAMLGLVDDRAETLHIKLRDYIPPKKATLHYQKALILIQRGMGHKAVRDLEEAANLDPKWAEPRVVLARVLRSEAKKQPDLLPRAEALLREAKTIRPGRVQTETALAEVLGAQGRYDEALAAADEALGLEPAFTPALIAKSRALRALRRPDEAGKAAAEAVELDPRNPVNQAELGEVAAAQGDWKRAAEALRRATELALEGRGEGR